MTPAEMEALARSAPNPFLDSVLRNGFEEPSADVPEIHAAQRARLRELIADVRRTGRLAIQVITGEPGDGKTHLLATLRAEAERSWLEAGAERAMVPIEPLREPEAPFAHMLRSAVSGLWRPLARRPPEPEGPASPIEYVLWRVLRRAVVALAAAGDETATDAAAAMGTLEFAKFPRTLTLALTECWSRLEPALLAHGSRLPGFTPDVVDPEVWSVLCRLPRRGLQPLVLRWLGGHSLPEEDLAVLGAAEPLDGENRAFLALSSLLHLSDVPIVLGFDQLEGVHRLGEEAVVEFLQALGDNLYGRGGRALVLLFCQADVWEDFLRNVRKQTRDRLLQLPPLHLESMSPELGEKLVAQRLAALWRGHGIKPPHPTFPYPEGFVRRAIAEKQLRGPRSVLAHFASLGLTSSPPEHAVVRARPPREVAREAFARFREEAARDATRSPEEQASVAQAALSSVLGRAAGAGVGETRVVAAERARVGKNVKAGVRAKLARPGKEVTVYAEASNSSHGASAAATVKRLRKSLESSDRALLLRDERVRLPAAAASALAELQGKAALVRVGTGDFASFAAIERLLNEAASKDLEVGEDAAAAFVLDEIAPSIESVRRFLDAAFAEESQRPATDAQSVVLSAIARPPYSASEAQIGRAHGLSSDDVARASDALEQAGKAAVFRTKDGDRVVMRRPR